jgi:hypothetical protein
MPKRQKSIEEKVVNFPVPEWLGKQWRENCDEWGIDYSEDLAALLWTSRLWPRRAHYLFRALAYRELDGEMLQTAEKIIERVQAGIDDVFPPQLPESGRADAGTVVPPPHRPTKRK